MTLASNVLRLPSRRRSRGRARPEGDGALVRLPAPEVVSSPAPELGPDAGRQCRGEVVAALASGDVGALPFILCPAVICLPAAARLEVARVVVRLLDRSTGKRGRGPVAYLRPVPSTDGGAR